MKLAERDRGALYEVTVQYVSSPIYLLACPLPTFIPASQLSAFVSFKGIRSIGTLHMKRTAEEKSFLSTLCSPLTHSGHLHLLVFN